MEGSSIYSCIQAGGKHGPSSSSSRILLRAANSEGSGRDGVGNIYRCIDFHTVDLNDHKIYFNTLPSFLSRVGRGEMHQLEDSIYIIGGLYTNNIPPLAPGVEPDKHHHTGASRLSGGGGRWDMAPSSHFNRTFLACVSLSGKIYNFGSRTLQPLLFDPATDEWTDVSPTVPSSLADILFCRPIIPDHARNRILIHLSRPSKLVAFYPSTMQWECLSRDPKLSICWEDYEVAVALLNDVLYFYNPAKCRGPGPGPISAFDVSAGKWLAVVWSSTNLGDLKSINLFRFDDILTWPGAAKEDLLCLASFVQSRLEEPPFIIAGFIRLRVDLSGGSDGDDDDDSTITLTPISTDAFKIPSTELFFDSVPL